MKVTHILNVSNTIPNYFEDAADMNIDYLKINIEDNSEVPIKLFFSVAYNFIEGAFNESRMQKQDKSLRNNALVDDYCLTMQAKDSF